MRSGRGGDKDEGVLRVSLAEIAGDDDDEECTDGKEEEGRVPLENDDFEDGASDFEGEGLREEGEEPAVDEVEIHLRILTHARNGNKDVLRRRKKRGGKR